MPRCKHCKDKFEVKYFNQKYHLDRDECIKAMVEANTAKLKKDQEKARKADTKERKEKIKTHSNWLQDLQKVFNEFIRLRDKDQPCISCGTLANVKYDCGHFFSVGGFPNVRFDEDNCSKQCSNYCNINLSANIHNYRPRLIEKIGVERFEALEFRARNKPSKLSIPEIKDLIIVYRNKIKTLKE